MPIGRLGTWAPATVLGLIAVACGEPRYFATGFRLPEGGDVERGRAVFSKYQCHTCHEVAGADFPVPTQDLERPVGLGGVVHEVRTDGYLVTSIINPTHRVRSGNEETGTVEGVSRMPSFVHTMTVLELTDLVEFVQSTYTFTHTPVRP